MRGYETTEETFRPLIEAMEADGGEWPAPQVQKFMGIEDVRNLARRMAWPIERGMIHRRREGPRSFYIVGPDPDAKEAVGDFEPALYGDGTLTLVNCPVDSQGDPCMNKAQAKRLLRLLNGQLLA